MVPERGGIGGAIMTRRGLFKWLGRIAISGAAVGSYAFAIEPGFLLRTQYYALTPPRWTPGLKLRLVLIADPHLGEPYMSLGRWKHILDVANGLGGDLNLLLGDYQASHRFISKRIEAADLARVAAQTLTSRLGTFSIMGNHDWWGDRAAQKSGQGPTANQIAFEAAGIPVLENKAVRLMQNEMPFWLSGTASYVAIYKGRRRFEGRDDLPATLAQVTDEAPIIHMAHEPDLFTKVPDRVSLTLSGHTHGGQVRIAGWSPIVPSQFGNRYAYGHVVEGGRHLIVSGGLGCSTIPVRLGVPPEIVVVDLG
jgi:uncharacterized protein